MGKSEDVAQETGQDGRYVFQVLAGEHQGIRRVYKKGEIFRSNYELDVLFGKEKFQRLPDSGVTSDVEPERKRRSDVADRVIKEMLPFTFDEASNVTHLFPEAAEHGLAVYKDSLNGYAIAEADAKVKENLAGGVLGSKKAVNAWLKDFTAGYNEAMSD